MRKALMILSIMVTAALFNTTVFASVNDDQVTSQKIKEADGTSGQNTNSGSGVKTGHIQDGAVTDAKITGPISASKLQKPANIIVVAKSGGDFSSIGSALDSINPSATNPYVIKVMPGIYVEKVTLKSFIHLQGSGADVTTIQSPCPSCNEGVVNIFGLSNLAVSDFTIYGGNSGYINSWGVYISASSPLINDLTIDSHMEGIRSDGTSSPVIRNNVIRSSRIAAIDLSGVPSGNSQGSITGNRILGNSGDGIRVAYASPTIVGNIITDSNTGIGTVYSSSEITGNTITNGSYEGISVGTGGVPIIRGNNIVHCGYWGIRVLNSSTAQIIQNIITNHSMLDIWVDSSSTANISFNIYDTVGMYDTVSDTPATGFYNVKSDGSPASAL